MRKIAVMVGVAAIAAAVGRQAWFPQWPVRELLACRRISDGTSGNRPSVGPESRRRARTDGTAITRWASEVVPARCRPAEIVGRTSSSIPQTGGRWLPSTQRSVRSARIRQHANPWRWTSGRAGARHRSAYLARGDHHHAHDGHNHPGHNYGHYYGNDYGNLFGYSHYYGYSSYAFMYETEPIEVCRKVWSKKRHRQILICSTYYQY